LKEISKVEKAEFLSNWKLNNSALWLLYTAIQGCIDIAMHVISSKTLRTPESYSDAFYVLAEAGILSSKEAEEFADMARFRNVLAHTYARVNLEIAYGILQKKLDGIEKLYKRLLKELAR